MVFKQALICAILLGCGGGAEPIANDGGSHDGSQTNDNDPAVEFCPWIAETSYEHESDAFFERSEVIRIDVEMDPLDWQFQLENPDLEEYRDASVTWCGQRVDGAGMRFKKSSHPNADLEEGYPKNPIILDLNESVPGQRLRKLRKINLEYESDLMLVAQRLNWEMAADFGLNVPRVNHSRLYVNGEFIGVFLNLERVDRSYVKKHFGENEGQLYKHAYCGTFAFAGSEASDYMGDPRCYAPKPNDSVTDYKDLIHVIDVLNNTPEVGFASEFSAVWDIDEWISTAATLQVLAYGDSPNANGNNFYTYFPPTGPARIALWDFDAGYFQDGAPCEREADTISWGLFQIADCFNSLALFDRVFSVPQFRSQFLDRARSFHSTTFDPERVSQRADEIVELIAPALAEDTNRKGNDAEWAAAVQQLKSRQAARYSNVDSQLTAEGR